VPGADPLIGKIIGTYKIVLELGHGGMGKVYKAHDVSLDRPVALKVLPPHMAQEEEFIKRFSREARACAKLNHPNIVTVYGVGRHDDLYFIAMEFIDGDSLAGLMAKSGKFDTHRALEIIRQAAEALAEAHSKGIVHRDIKPQNIMIDVSGRVRVMDFGLAWASYGTTRLTASGSVLGTPHYMSPEQWSDSQVDGRSDIYSLGVTLFEMLAGEPPFTGETPVVIMRKAVMENAPPLMNLNPNVPPRLSGMVAKMIAKKPGDRYGSVAELAAEIDAYMGTHREAPPVVAAVSDFSPRGYESQLAEFDRQVGEPTEVRGTAAQPLGESRKTSVTPQPLPESRKMAVTPQPAAPAAKKSPLVWIIAAAAAVVLAGVGVLAWRAMTKGGAKEFESTIFAKDDFVWIEPGTFVMGSAPDEPGREPDEAQHTVTISRGFWMGKCEVTQRQWAAVMGNNPSALPGENLPVEYVSWYEVQDFIRRLNELEGADYRLPTEAEWEYACRAGTTTVYSLGDDPAGLDAYAWYQADSEGRTHDVGTKKPNAWGLYDMHGNVWEWCQDWVGPYPLSSVTDPTGSPGGKTRVGRGGSMGVGSGMCRSADRSAADPENRGADLGFRLCR